ncbi:MAG: hypothetical protein QOC92_4568 [Acidimicrobiaceae bacterium]
MNDPLQYEGRRVLVTGAASGMGEACASILGELGAEVIGLDVKDAVVELADFFRCDLSDPGQTDDVVDRVGEPVDALFNCAGLPTTAPGQKVMQVNFLGHRHLTESILPAMGNGGGIAFISSVAGAGWLPNIAALMPLLETQDFASGKTWCEEHPDLVGPTGYGFSKQAINAYVALRGFQLAPVGIRMNSINPGPTDTPMMPSFIESTGPDFFERLPKPIGRNARPDEQAWALVMLNSPRSSYTTATTLFTDGGFTGGLLTGNIDTSLLTPQEPSR